MFPINRLPLLLILAALAGCTTPAPRIQRNGFSVIAYVWDEAERTVRSQAAFAMHCPPEGLELKLLAVDDPQSRLQSIGATGCGQETLWVQLAQGTWVQNGTRKD